MAHSEAKRRRVEGVSDEMKKLEFDDIREEDIVRGGGEEGQNKGSAEEDFMKDILCDLCMSSNKTDVFMCFSCSKYGCLKCFCNHDTNHKYVNVNSNQSERERTRDKFLDEMWNERDIEENFETESVCVCDRVDVKHELDKYVCGITGLCGLENRRWVVCDYRNNCIKIFRCGSNVLLRYLRIGSKPYDVTEIRVKQNSTVPDSASSSSSDISGTNRTKPDKQCLLVVTLPGKHHILFIDINKNPAVRAKHVSIGKRCYGIEHTDERIFTVCDENPSLYGPRWSVYVMSTDGVKLSIIQTGIYGDTEPVLAVLPGRVYLTDMKNSKIKCIDYQGIVLSKVAMGGWKPVGISVDPENNVYVITRWHPDSYIRKFDSNLTGWSSLLDRSMENPQALCFYRDKLFVSHRGKNLVSVISLI